MVIDEEQVMACAMAAMPSVGQSRLGGLLLRQTPSQAWKALGLDDNELLARMEVALEHHRIGVTYIGHPSYPVALQADPTRPAVLFHQGSLEHLAHRRVGVIGTRGATASGRYMASHLGFDLAVNHVSVVSGLARGIDVWAHRGVRSAHDANGVEGVAVGVVGSGLNVIYPPEHDEMWSWVSKVGLLLSEHAPGVAPHKSHFPMRNRLIAALAEVVVVVESRAAGGSMITVAEAIKRDVTVLAVPGSPRVDTSRGTNQLIAQGCTPVTDVDDVLVALGLDTRRAGRRSFDSRRSLDPFETHVVRAIGFEALTIDQIVMRTGSNVAEVAVTLGRLERDGWLLHNDGWWEVLQLRQRSG